MDAQFSWFFDAAVICLFLIFIYIGGKRGFIGSVLILCSYIVSLLLALTVSKTLSPVIYDRLISEEISSSIETKISDLDIAYEVQKAINRENLGIEIDKDTVSEIIGNSQGSIAETVKNKVVSEIEGTGKNSEGAAEKIDEIFDNNITDKFLNLLPDYISDIIKESVRNGSDTISEIIRALNSTPDTAALFIEQSIIRPVIVSILSAAIFIVVFIVLKIITGFAVRLIKCVDKIPVIGSLNTFLGIVLGIIEAIAVILLIVMILRFMIAVTNNEMIAFNTQNIEATNIFRLFYNMIVF